MRLILICLTALLVLIQIPLWFGKGGWLRVWELSHQLDSALAKEQQLKARNAQLASEVQDLKEGTGAVEERARFELGLIKDNEIFVQVVEPGSKVPPPAPPKAATKPVTKPASKPPAKPATQPAAKTAEKAGAKVPAKALPAAQAKAPATSPAAASTKPAQGTN